MRDSTRTIVMGAVGVVLGAVIAVFTAIDLAAVDRPNNAGALVVLVAGAACIVLGSAAVVVGLARRRRELP
jgi:uncharacterized protein YacL